VSEDKVGQYIRNTDTCVDQAVYLDVAVYLYQYYQYNTVYGAC